MIIPVLNVHAEGRPKSADAMKHTKGDNGTQCLHEAIHGVV